ncbi:MAG: hypothetical protein GWN67_16040 [Phycisphaerae bacterium]|nr:hypothetical protein [Fodinibius sp.]NIU57842.1 hypothetical protein [Phycisphaerae bacterium]NIV12482.1 hypothetical protein [Fodinibius sp.]NIW94280.1 hypothetical protein [Phycisphaerae bacterium]NIY26170.1 hypothetical protein [Fodinibius sp.]
MRTTYINIISVVSVLLFTIVCTTVPALARVDIWIHQGGEPNEFIIYFDAMSEVNPIRAFALDIRLSNDANITEVTGISDDYYIYPGTILIDAQGNVTDFGSPVAENSDLPSGTLTGLDSNGITIEMASLYAPVGPGSPNAPARSGDLLSIILSDRFFPIYDRCGNPVNGGGCITISGNAARAGNAGVVMENPNEIVDVYFYEYCAPFPSSGSACMKVTSPDYDNWEEWNCPACWCYSRQCRGDSDGIKTGPFWVAIPDLNAFRAAFNKTDLALQGITNGICSDFDHIKTGPFRAAIPDLNIFRLYFNKPELAVPECDMTNYNFWEIP